MSRGLRTDSNNAHKSFRSPNGRGNGLKIHHGVGSNPTGNTVGFGLGGKSYVCEGN